MCRRGPKVPISIPTMIGPPASPSFTGVLMPGMGIGIAPNIKPRTMPMNTATRLGSFKLFMAFPNTFSTLWIKKIFHIPIVAIEHWSKLNVDHLFPSLLIIGKIAYSNADKIISVSFSLHGKLKKFWNIDSLIVYNMCDDKFFYRSGKRKKKMGEFIFVSVGRLVAHKRFDMLIQAFIQAHFPQNVKLYIVGLWYRKQQLFHLAH